MDILGREGSALSRKEEKLDPPSFPGTDKYLPRQEFLHAGGGRGEAASLPPSLEAGGAGERGPGGGGGGGRRSLFFPGTYADCPSSSS